ncbi:BrnT family toxin [Kumtagia ephedrae]|jgi:hypothetical protein|uniref:BrnT family toxin n=1 Tax=Kumtagia ephedrae TaxID=2116701 RepID=A0A2P7S5I4_9HYPH|nr:BrnT family toxin [Mesorhizobium ephedrae]PSJ57691.1 hypothetical protein C7I84_16795 [Mesorhizobium ephedrae]
MKFEWDEEKYETNKAKHGIVFDLIHDFDILTALVVEDDRFDYGETRLVGIGLIHTRIMVVVYTERGDVVRVISLRKANRKEIRFYVENL